MKKKYIIIPILIIILIVIFKDDNKNEIKKTITTNNNIKNNKKEMYKFITVDYDNINELLKEEVTEEVIINYVCDEEYKNGFIKKDDKIYFYEDNKMIKGLTNINDDTYYFDDDGVMVFNKIVNDYYFDYEGKMKIGEIEYNNNKYYFNETGMIKDDFVDGKYYDLNGSYVENMKKDDNVYYYENNEKIKGLKLINNIRYYFDFNNGKLISKNIKSIIDISTWQDKINFDVLKDSNEIDGVIVRAGYGTSNDGECTLDNTFERNIKELTRLNIPYGIYIYGYAKDKVTAFKEADFIKDIIEKYNLKLSFPIFYDAELTYHNDFYYSSEVYSEVINSFINRLNEYNYKNIGLYGNLYMLTKGSLSFEHNYPIWVAEYNDRCEYDKEYYGWQYTSKGSVPGIDGNVDLSIFY